MAFWATRQHEVWFNTFVQIPSFEYELKYRQNDQILVAGLDEVGRGAFAGPVVASAVVFKKYKISPKLIIRDSKKMTSIQRLKSSRWIRKKCYWGIGEADVDEINKYGIGRALKIAYKRAITALEVDIDLIIIDGNLTPNIHEKEISIVKGDSISCSIAAASIVAKVYRDNLMQSLGERVLNDRYLWHSNKGYGTKAHRERIIEFGPCKYHRIQFVDTFLKKNT